MSVNWWLLTEVWVTARVLKSPLLFSVFRLVLIIQWFRVSLLDLLFLSLQCPWAIFNSATITVGITVIFLFHSFFLVLKQDLSIYLSFRFLLILLCGLSRRKIQFRSFFVDGFVDYHKRSGHLAEIGWSVCILKSQIGLYISFSSAESRLYMYYFFVWSNLNFFGTIHSGLRSPSRCV